MMKMHKPLSFSMLVVRLSVKVEILQTWLLNNSPFWISQVLTLQYHYLSYGWQRPQAIRNESLLLIYYPNRQHGPILPAWDHPLWSRARKQVLNFWTMSAMDSQKAAVHSELWRAFFPSSWNEFWTMSAMESHKGRKQSNIQPSSPHAWIRTYIYLHLSLTG